MFLKSQSEYTTKKKGRELLSQVGVLCSSIPSLFTFK